MESMTEIRNRAKELGVEMKHGITKPELAKAVAEAEVKSLSPSIEVNKLENPELAPVAVMNAVVADTVTDDQRRAKFEQEIRDKIASEEIEKRLRKEAQIAERAAQQMDKYKLNYDLPSMKLECEKLLSAIGAQFVIDTHPDGSLKGTYHMFGNGKIGCGNLAQPLATILRDVRYFCATKIDKDMPTRNDMVRSQFTGQPIATPVHVVGQSIADNSKGDVALGE